MINRKGYFMDKVRISVIMACYNGEKYVVEQLDSIRNQTLQPDEVIICDDNSSDETVKIINKYIDKYSLDTWQLIINKENIGWMKNFHQLLKKVNGEIIFFSDQDDIWKSNKIEIMIDEMKKNDNIKVLTCKADFINSSGNKITVSPKALPFGYIGKERIKKNEFNKKFIYSIFPGCTMAIRADIINIYNSCALDNIPHDALYWKMATLNEQAYILNLPLISYRIHSSNASSPLTNSIPHIKTSSDRIKEITTIKFQIENIIKLYEKNVESKKYKVLQEMLKFTDWRLTLFDKKYITPQLFGYVKYFKFYNGFRMFCGDIVAIVNYTKGETK